MNPVQDLQHLRDFIHQKETAETVGKLSSAPWFVSQYTAEKYAEGEAKGRADALAEAVRVLKEETELSDEAIASKLQLDVSQVAGINIAAKSSKPSSS